MTLSGPNSGFSLIIRALESVDDLLIIFCKDGVRLAGFNSRQRRPQQDCRTSNIGGFSVPFEYLITYEGSPSLLLGRQINATTAATCEDPASRYFLLLGELLVLHCVGLSTFTSDSDKVTAISPYALLPIFSWKGVWLIFSCCIFLCLLIHDDC